ADRDLPKPAPGFVEKKKYELKAEPQDETVPKDNFIEQLKDALSEKPTSSEESWTTTISNVKEVPKKPNWKGDLYWVELEDGRSAATWNKALADDAKIMIG